MPVDICNKKIEPGALVVYPRRVGSFMWLVLAEVVSVSEDRRSIKVRPIKTTDPFREILPGHVVTVFELSRVVVVAEPAPDYVAPPPPPVKVPRVPKPPAPPARRRLATKGRRRSRLTPPANKILGPHPRRNPANGN